MTYTGTLILARGTDKFRAAMLRCAHPTALIARSRGRAPPIQAGRHMFDARLALTLRHHGVDEFATRNAKDFEDFGFSRVWDPIKTVG